MNARKKSNAVIIGGIIFLIIALLVIINILVGGKLLSIANIKVLVASCTVPSLTAWGILFVFTGNITDLSPGAIIILAGTVAGLLGNQFGILAMVIGSLAVGMLCMLLNFTIYRVTRIPAWIAGLGMTMVYEAAVGYYASICSANGQKVVTLANDRRFLGQQLGIYIMLVIGFIIAYLIYNHSTIGIEYRAVGNNEEVAKTMGVKINKTMLLGGVCAGFFIGFSAFVKESYAGFMNAQSGLGSLSGIFQSIAAVLLAMALANYINVIVAIPISTLFIVLIFNILTLFRVPSGTFQEALLGFIVIAFAILAQRKVKGVVK